MRQQRFVVLGVLIALLSAPLTAGASGQPVGRPVQAEASASTVDLNTANESELVSLPGIGPAMAERIMEYRREHGGFTKIEELMNVRGIGEKSFLKLKPLVSVTPAKAKPLGSSS